MGARSRQMLFSWAEVEESSELERLQRVLETIPDRKLIQALEQERDGHNDEYPLEPMWNSLIAQVVLGHKSGESLRRELRRNSSLRAICGFDLSKGEAAVPPDYVYSRLFTKLARHKALVVDIMNGVLEMAMRLLPDLGEIVAADGKAIPTHGEKDRDADWGRKEKRVVSKKTGRVYTKEVKWFGFKLHLLVDAKYELPLAFLITKASVHESPMLLPLLKQLKETHPKLYERIQMLLADKGYDDGTDKKALYDEEHIIPLIDTRDLHADLQPLDPKQSDTIYFSGMGEVCCKVDPFHADKTKQYAPMHYEGFEEDRQSLKFRCPAQALGIECKNRETCRCAPLVRDGHHGRIVRVPLERDRRLFAPIYRHSKRFKRIYRKRSSVERVNSRIDNVYGFEDHFIRGKAHMELRMTLSVIVMLATAVAWVRAGKKENVRSLLLAA